MFKRKAQLQLTNDAYSRWLRALRPPLEFFLQRSELEQEQLAIQGDEYMEDIALAVGQAVSNPQASDAHLRAHRGDPAGDIKLAQMMAENVAARIVGAQQGTMPRHSKPDAPTMAGFGKRKHESAKVAGQREDLGTELFGQQPKA